MSNLVKNLSFLVLYKLVPFYQGERGGLVVNASDSRSRGREVQAPLGSNHVVSLSKAHLLPKNYW